MKRLARFLIGVYPAEWRARYGDELEALIEDSPAQFTTTYNLFTGALKMHFAVPSFPKLALILSITGLLAGLGVSYVVTPVYMSSATMEFSHSSQGTATTVLPNLREYFSQMENEILSRTSLSSVIQNPRLELYQRQRANTPLEDVIENMRRDIRITPTSAPGQKYFGFSISFLYFDRLKTRETVQVLMTKFMDSNFTRQRVTAYAKRQRTYDQVDRMEARIAVLEKRLGILSPPPEPLDTPVRVDGGINLSVLDPPILPVSPLFPNRAIFMATGFGAGFFCALIAAVFRRKAPPIPFPAQTA